MRSNNHILPKPHEIQVTKNYKMFKFIGGNRILENIDLRSIRRSIEQENLLDINPITVNEKYEVIDGQRRLLVAQEKKLPIFYIIKPGLTLKHVVITNTATKIWNMEDYLHLFIEQGNKDYKTLKEFSQRYKISLSNSLAILSIGRFTNLIAPNREFKQGLWRITNLDEAVEFVKKYQEISIYTEENVSKDRNFIQAIYRMLYRKKIPFEEMMSALKKYSHRMYRRADTRDYMLQFEDIYVRMSGGRKRKIRFV